MNTISDMEYVFDPPVVFHKLVLPSSQFCVQSTLYYGTRQFANNFFFGKTNNIEEERKTAVKAIVATILL